MKIVIKTANFKLETIKTPYNSMRSYKYFLHTQKTYDRLYKTVIRNCRTEEVRINEYVDLPSISVDIDRMKQNLIQRPHNSKYEKNKEIKLEDFNLYLSISFDVFKSLRWGDEAEFFINKPYQSGWEVVMFTNSTTNRYRVDIKIDADLEWGDVRLDYSDSYVRRNQYRKKAKVIDENVFEYILTETITFLEDDQNYGVNFDALLKVIQDSYEGKVVPVMPTSELDLTPLLMALNDQIKQIESRLMNTDTDRKGMRERLRGRSEGLKAAVNEIKGFERELIS